MDEPAGPAGRTSRAGLGQPASRAGLLHFPLFSQLLGSKYPKKIPGALRAPDCFIFLCFCCFGPNTPKKSGALRAPDCFILLCFLLVDPKYPIFPGALRAPDGFISLWFCLFRIPNTPKFPRRASRAGLLYFPMFCCFWTLNNPKIFRRASRAGLLHFLCFCCFLTRKP